MSPTTLPTIRRQPGLNGRHVLIAFLAFFGAVFLVNGAMIYSAVSTYSGLVANEPYRKGLHYNERIAASERQAKLGWTETVSIAVGGRVRFTLADRDHPVRGLKVSGVLGRPTTNRYDTTIALVEVEPGTYEAQAAGLSAGSWLVTLEARMPASSEPVYRTRRSLWLKP